MKILSIIGARPQFIKCAPLFRAIRKEHEEILVHTGQHYDPEMSYIFFNELQIPEPDYNLGVGSSIHGEQTGKMLIEIEKIFLKEKPDLILVYGDTNSTLAGALTTSKLHLKVAHVEAGLRSYDRTMPEEINRVLTDRVSDLLFCPTETAVLNLKKEGITKGVYNVGDVMLDSLKYNIKVAERKATTLEDMGLSSKEYLVATVHRASNTDSLKNLSSIVNAFCDVDIPIIFPVHPRTEKYLKHYGLWDKLCEKVKVIPPLGYLEMLKLMLTQRRSLRTPVGFRRKHTYLRCPA
ncbi:UDP-N-acetylglucosamine 2-epimerase [Methanosarcina siciliae C2J]|uniref:UDP-N-acetylglucosamine 2-epimerase n=1 Tax=Methanosarcina siciliae C2J TaxID=1434118 RepID=A0A0E3PMT2_9EURY|nr:UDP-N-acetylglucosamine 2-epimerase (non-hydrolyzing) [Methanosarcina siciliae]AKB36430.1 UDP-N-acetylglucosamine 2-epimerase [Methanosarcina siciliae C2J]